MGIRYYAYAFDADRVEQALTDPHSVLSGDPLADAWGLEPGAMVSVATFEQTVPERDMLYLDKTWRDLQALTGPGEHGEAPRPSFRMFEGRVAMHDEGWDPWVRTLTPEEVVEIDRDLRRISDEEAHLRFTQTARYGGDPDEEASFTDQFLGRARTFVARLAAEGRGMVYQIG